MKKKLLGIIVIFVGVISVLLPGCNTTSTQVNTTLTTSSQITKTTQTTSTTISTITDTPLNSSTIITTATNTASPYLYHRFQSPLTIDSTFNGKEIHVNLVKFTGTAPPTSSTVTIDDIPATMNSDGTYYAYLDLNPGKNIIEIKTNSYGYITSEQIAVTFTPPVTIFLNYPQYPPPSPEPNYTKVPIDIMGGVNNPAAKVEINGNAVAVSTDGSFSSRIQLKQGDNSIKAVATLGNDSDTDGFILTVFANGSLGGPPPFLIHSPWSSAVFPGASDPSGTLFSYQVGVGETAMEDVQLYIAKTDIGDRPPGGYYRPGMTRTSGVGTGDILPALSSLTIEFMPSAFKQYQRIDYHSFMVIKAGPDLSPGNYYFTVDFDLVGGAGPSKDNIVIAVQK